MSCCAILNEADAIMWMLMDGRILYDVKLACACSQLDRSLWTSMRMYSMLTLIILDILLVDRAGVGDWDCDAHIYVCRQIMTQQRGWKYLPKNVLYSLMLSSLIILNTVPAGLNRMYSITRSTSILQTIPKQ